MMKKLIWVMMMLLPFLLVGCESSEKDVMYNLLENSSCFPDVEQSSVYGDNIILSTAAYENVITHFTLDDGKFTDDFGGVYVDENGFHNVCVVGKRRPISSDYLIYKQVENSLNFLESIVDSLERESHDFTIWMMSICDFHNGVIICLENESKIPLILEHLKSNELLKKGTLNIFVGKTQVIPNLNTN